MADSLSASLSTTLLAFLSGLAIATGVAILLSHRVAVLSFWRRAAHRMATASARLWRQDNALIIVGAKEVQIEGDLNEKEKEDPPTVKKRFEFRQRLWNEPPEDLDVDLANASYGETYGHYDAVQRKFKNAGVKDLEWKTTWLDFVTEWSLLGDYQRWAQHRSWVGENAAMDVAFYRELRADLQMERDEIWDEFSRRRERAGRSEDEEAALWGVMTEAKFEEEAKRGVPH